MAKNKTTTENVADEAIQNEGAVVTAAEQEHSEHYDEVKTYYDNYLSGVKPQWSIERVKRAVVKEWITAEEYEEITGEPYEV